MLILGVSPSVEKDALPESGCQNVLALTLVQKSSSAWSPHSIWVRLPSSAFKVLRDIRRNKLYAGALHHLDFQISVT